MLLKLLEKQEQAKPKRSRWKEKLKVRADINEMETKRTPQRLSGKKVGSLKRKTRLTNT
jgi:hypothetical protein